MKARRLILAFVASLGCAAPLSGQELQTDTVSTSDAIHAVAIVPDWETLAGDGPDSLWNGALVGAAVLLAVAVAGVGLAGGSGEMDAGDWVGAGIVIGGAGGMLGAMVDAAIPWSD